MPTVLHAMPLVAIEAIALDTETTGLDVSEARIIEIGAVHVDGEAVRTAASFENLIKPNVPLPQAVTRITAIDANMLADAPEFRSVFPAFAAFAGNRVLIGHTIGYDVAMLAAECARAGLAFTPPVALDVRLLAEQVQPTLPDYALETLASWLDVPLGTRHRALGDAISAAHIFIALLPKLRSAGILTVGHALRTCRERAERNAHPWQDGQATPLVIAPPPRIDSYPYRHKVSDVMSTRPVFVAADTPLAAAVDIMAGQRISSVFVGEPTDEMSTIGILTERDTLRLLSQRGASILQEPCGPLATRPLISVAQTAFVYVAIGRMAARNIRHLAVASDDGRVVGAVSSRDLLRLRSSAAIALGDDLDTGADVAALGRAWAKLPAMAKSLLAEDVDARQVAAVIAEELATLTRRAAILAEQDMARTGLGAPPCAYALLILGSGGRGESLLAMDQDNALVFERGEPGGPEDRWFEALGQRVADILNAVGVPYCAGGVMAREPAFRGSELLWRRRAAEWLGRSRPADLLSVDIVFDLRAVHGDLVMGERLRHDIWTMARPQTSFLKCLIEPIGERRAFGLFGGLKTDDDGRIDIKAYGLFPLVSAARVLAIRHGRIAHSTQDRLQQIIARDSGGLDDLRRFADAHGVILRHMLGQQLADIAAGHRPSNRIDPQRLGRAEAKMLRDAIAHLAVIPVVLRDQLSEA